MVVTKFQLSPFAVQVVVDQFERLVGGQYCLLGER